jgi:hypothetical protein
LLSALAAGLADLTAGLVWARAVPAESTRASARGRIEAPIVELSGDVAMAFFFMTSTRWILLYIYRYVISQFTRDLIT